MSAVVAAVKEEGEVWRGTIKLQSSAIFNSSISLIPPSISLSLFVSLLLSTVSSARLKKVCGDNFD